MRQWRGWMPAICAPGPTYSASSCEKKNMINWVNDKNRKRLLRKHMFPELKGGGEGHIRYD